MTKTKIESELSRENIEEKDLSTLDDGDFVLNKEKDKESLDDKARELELLLQVIEEILKEGGREMVVENMREDAELLELADRLGNEIVKGPYKLAESMNLKDIGEAKEKLNRLLEKIRLFKEMDSKKNNEVGIKDSKIELASKHSKKDTKPNRFRNFVTGALVTLFGASPIIGNTAESFGADTGDSLVQADDAEYIEKLKEIEAKRKIAEGLKQTQNAESDKLPELEINKSLKKEVPGWCKGFLDIKAKEDGNFEVKLGPITYQIDQEALKELEDYKDELESKKPIGAKHLLKTGYEKRTKELIERELRKLGTNIDELKEREEETSHQKTLRGIRAKEKMGLRLSAKERNFLEDNKDEKLEDKPASASQKAEESGGVADDSLEVKPEEDLNPMFPKILNDIQEIREIRDEISKIGGTQDVIKPYNDERLDEFEKQAYDNAHNPNQLSILKQKIKNGLNSIKGTQEGLKDVKDTRPGGNMGGGFF
jgi:hypothetical protein